MEDPTEQISEELNNFLHRVNDVTSIIKKLSSTNKELQEIGTLEADKYLKDSDPTYSDSIDEENVKTVVKQNKTVINKKALLKDDKDPDTMSQGKKSYFSIPVANVTDCQNKFFGCFHGQPLITCDET